MKLDPRFEELYRREYGAVFKAAYFASGDAAVAEDAAQEAFVRAFERWSRLQGSEWVTGWLVTTALNLTKRRGRMSRHSLLPAIPRDDMASVDARIDAQQALRSLPARQQEAVVLHYLIDLPVSEVAQIMGCAEGTVKAHLSKAREAMARRVDRTGREEGS